MLYLEEDTVVLPHLTYVKNNEYLYSSLKQEVLDEDNYISSRVCCELCSIFFIPVRFFVLFYDVFSVHLSSIYVRNVCNIL